MEAFEKYGLEKMFKDILPAGNHRIKVVIDSSLKGTDKWMQAPSAKEIRVNPDVLDKSLAFIGIKIGHELIHVRDHINGILDASDLRSVYRGEIRAYHWERRNSGDFGFVPSYRQDMSSKINYYNELIQGLR